MLAGHTPPPIWVSRCWLCGEAVYIVSDGHHRTCAARLYHKERIAAQVAYDLMVDGSVVVLTHSDAWLPDAKAGYAERSGYRRVGEIRSFITRKILMDCGAQPAPWLQDNVTIPIDTRKGG